MLIAPIFAPSFKGKTHLVLTKFIGPLNLSIIEQLCSIMTLYFTLKKTKIITKMRKTFTFKSLLCTIPLLLLFAVIGTGQSFYKTYSSTNSPSKIREISNGYLLELKGFNKFEIITTDANGNLQSRRTDDFSNADGFQVTYRMRNGEYLLYKIEDNVGQLKFQVRDQNNNIKRAFTLFYPAGEKGAIGAIEQYEDDKVFIAYSYGTGDFGDPQPRTIAYVKRNIYNDRNDMSGSFQTVGEVINSPTGAELLPDGTIYMTILQDLGSFYQSYIAKINASGNLVWRKQAATLERFITNFTADVDGHIWNAFSQSITTVVKRDKYSGEVTTSYVPDQFGFSGNDVGAIVTPPLGGILMIAGAQREFRASKIGSTGINWGNHTVIESLTDGNNKNPKGAIITTDGKVVVFGNSGGNPFIMKLGENANWETGGNNGNSIDMELEISSNNTNPGVWTKMATTITAKNTGSATATNVKVKVEIPDNDIVLEGSNPFTASTGSFSWWGPNEWNIGTLAAGSTATLTLNFYNKNSNSKKVCAQVTAATGSGDDSTPNNGGNCSTSEDDEVSTTFNGGGTSLLPSLWASDFKISTVPMKQGEVRNFTFDLKNTGKAAVQGDYVINVYMSRSPTDPGNILVGNINTGNTAIGRINDVPGALTVPSNLQPDTYYVHLVVDANNQVPEEREGDNRRTSSARTVEAAGGNNSPDLRVRNVRPTATNVTIGENVSVQFDHESIGATIPQNAFPIEVTLYLSTDRILSTNDFKVLDLNIGIGTNVGLGGQVPTNLPAGEYYLIVQSDTPNRLAESNENNNVDASYARVTATAPSTGGGGAIDVSMTANTTSPNQWGFFSVQLIAKNTGSSTASNVKVSIEKPDEVTYKGGDTHSASQGSFAWWSNGEWNIGSLGANQSATITINYFRLSPNGFALTGSVTSGGGNDSATVNFGNAANGVNNRSAIVKNMTEEPFVIVNAYPNPSTDYIELAVYANEAQTSDLEIFSLTGKRIFGNQYELIEGLNEIRIETTEFPTGNYFIQMDPFHKYLRQLNFVVVRP